MLLENKIELLNSFDKLAFAISGGKDSMALLHFAINHIDKNKFFVITVHHNLRGKEGERDREFVKQYCLENGVECRVYEEQIKEFCQENGYTIEQGARIRRRAIFSQIVKDKEADRVVTAHHKDDQIESILMHIFRGSGLQGLCGMKEDDGILLRPMLSYDSKEIKEYLTINNIKYVQDSTNLEVEYSRNNVRNIIRKDIEKVYPNFGDNLIRLSGISNKMKEYIDEQTPKYVKTSSGVAIMISDIKSKDIIASQCIINAVEAVSTRVDLENVHIENVFDLVNKENGKSVMLPFGVIASREYDRIVFTKKEDTPIEPTSLEFGKFYLGDWAIEISNVDNGGLRADMEKLKGSIIKNREHGFTFKRFKGGTKSLGDYLTDIKVPKRMRDYLPIIVKDKEVLAVLPYEIADSVAVTENTKEIAYIRAEHN